MYFIYWYTCENVVEVDACVKCACTNTTTIFGVGLLQAWPIGEIMVYEDEGKDCPAWKF